MNIRCAMRDLQAGMILSKAIYAADGRVLVEEGTVLTDYLIQNLRERALVSVMIQRPEHLAVYVEKTAPPETKTALPVISKPAAAPDKNLPPVLLPTAAVRSVSFRWDFIWMISMLKSWRRSVMFCTAFWRLGYAVWWEPGC